MFAKDKNTVNITTQSDNQIITELLQIHKKLKQIAKSEYSQEVKFNIANITPDELVKIKLLESNIDCSLVAYRKNTFLYKKKLAVLNKINLLLNDFTNLNNSSKNESDEFSEFFAQ